jgi:hypothetical protein
MKDITYEQKCAAYDDWILGEKIDDLINSMNEEADANDEQEQKQEAQNG